MRCRRLAAAVVTLVATASGVLATGAAQAVTGGQAQATQSVTSATWSAVATSALPVGTPTGVLNIGLAVLNAPVYFWVTNTGTTDLSQSQYTVSYSVTAVGIGLGALYLVACVGSSATWNEITNICSGGVQTILTSTSMTAGGGSITRPSTPGSRVRLQLVAASLNVAVVAQVSVSVTIA